MKKNLVITSNEIVWNYYWFPAKDIICMSSGISFLVLIGLRDVQPYAPFRFMRGQSIKIPSNDDISRFAYDTPPSFAFNCENTMNIWYMSMKSELSEIVVEQDKGKVVPRYLSWFHDPMTFG